MAVLVGFDTWDAAETVATPITLGETLLTLTVPAGTAIGGFDLEASVLDSNATPLITLNVGDAADEDRFVADDEGAQTATLLEYRPLSTAWYRYSTATDLLVKVGTAPATGASGALALTLYGYPSVDRAVLVRQTLQALGVVAEGETPRAEDAGLVLAALADVHEMLRGKRLANRQDLAWPLAAVPLFAARPYAALAADLMADTFGLSTQRAQRLAARAAEAMREMRRQTYTRTSGDPVSLEPYQEQDVAVTDYGVLL